MSTLQTHLDAFAESFWRQVDSSGGPDACHPWMGNRDSDGYGLLNFQGTRTRASRVALVLTQGPLKPGEVARHTCDNPICANPAHLIPGTHRDNAADRDQRGRNGKAKLDPERVKSLRVMFYIERKSNRQIAEETGLHLTTVHNITAGRTWQWVQAGPFVVHPRTTATVPPRRRTHLPR